MEAGLLQGQTAPPSPENAHLGAQTLVQNASICVQRACEGKGRDWFADWLVSVGLYIGLYILACIRSVSVEKDKTPVLLAAPER